MHIHRISFSGVQAESSGALTAFRAAKAFDDPRLDGYGWLFVRALDGNISAIQQDHGPVSADRGSA